MRLIFGLNNYFYDRPAVVCGVLRFSDLPGQSELKWDDSLPTGRHGNNRK